MFGLAFLQLALILAGVGLLIVGVYGLAPTLVIGSGGGLPAMLTRPRPYAAKERKTSTAPPEQQDREVDEAEPPATAAVIEEKRDAVPDKFAVVEQDLVDELFAEMFSLRSTMADLVGEVQQLRTEHRPRRFVLEEVAD